MAKAKKTAKKPAAKAKDEALLDDKGVSTLPGPKTPPPPAAKSSTPLRTKQEAFCREYIKDLNATRAAKDAGYSEKTACAIGSENLRKPHIVQRIAILQKEAVERLPNVQEHESEIDETLKHLKAMAHSNIMDYFTLDAKGMPQLDLAKATRDQTAGIAKIRIKQLEPVMIPVMVGKGDAGEVELLTREVTQIDISLWDKNKAVENMAKHLGLLKEKPMEINITMIDKVMMVLRRELEAKGIDVNEILADLDDDSSAALITSNKGAGLKI